MNYNKNKSYRVTTNKSKLLYDTDTGDKCSANSFHFEEAFTASRGASTERVPVTIETITK